MFRQAERGATTLIEIATHGLVDRQCCGFEQGCTAGGSNEIAAALPNCVQGCSAGAIRGWLNGGSVEVRGRWAVTSNDPIRFSVPLYTVADAARIVGVPSSTLASWAQGYVRRFPNRPDVVGGPIITHLQSDGLRQPTIPFVGLAEALVLAAVRKSGVPMQRIRPALQQLQTDIGLEHALASRKLFTDGAELLFDYGEHHSGSEGAQLVRSLVVVRNGQRVFVEVVEAYLSRIEYAADGYAALIRVPVYEHACVVADPSRAFGLPIFERGGVRVDDVLERFWAGDPLDELSAEFGVPVEELEDVLRVASRRAA